MFAFFFPLDDARKRSGRLGKMGRLRIKQGLLRKNRDVRRNKGFSKTS